jgi:hypothetical protein
MQIPFLTKTGLLRKSLLILPLVGLLSACGSDNDPKTDPNSKVLRIDFNESVTGWKAGFADYPIADAEIYHLASGQESLPASLGTNLKGYKLSGVNRSDDLFMFVTRKFEGLQPNTVYDFQFELTFGTNAQKNCMGVGGSPGEAVYIKAGAVKSEPKAENDGAGFLLMNIDKGNQAVGGSDAVLLGDFANSRECGDANTDYEKKTLRSEKGSFSTATAADGSVWILFATDSGFESGTTIYLMSAKVAATKK